MYVWGNEGFCIIGLQVCRVLFECQTPGHTTRQWVYSGEPFSMLFCADCAIVENCILSGFLFRNRIRNRSTTINQCVYELFQRLNATNPSRRRRADDALVDAN